MCFVVSLFFLVAFQRVHLGTYALTFYLWWVFEKVLMKKFDEAPHVFGENFLGIYKVDETSYGGNNKNIFQGEKTKRVMVEK